MRTLLVDANGLACRLWWAMPHDVPRRFERTIERVAEAQGCGRVVIAWDPPGATWRSEIMPGYKAHRAPKPKLLTEALLACRALTVYRMVCVPGYEADDVIGTLADIEVSEGRECVIMSDDKDLAQLVSPLCWLVNAKGVETREAQVRARFGVPPHLIRTLLSWTGDTADGLPGKPGVGPKRGAERALTGAIGDATTYELAGLATVPGLEPQDEGFA